MAFSQNIFSRFEMLYGKDRAEHLTERLIQMLQPYAESTNTIPRKTGEPLWDESDAVLITYGDVIHNEQDDRPKLQLLQDFMRNYVGDAVSTVHVLPFFPSSSDNGFSVIDYKQVRDDLGDWDDVKSLCQNYDLMLDLVINHTSRHSKWFWNFEHEESPGKDYFINIDPELDLSQVTRPRNSALKTSVNTPKGLQYVWTTFSDDQIDVNFANPEVLFEYLNIFLFYLRRGAKVIRLDAIAYLWKKIGTTCINLEETHQMVKLFRDILDYLDSDVTLITETNVPFDQNVQYFGEGDEAHMIYQFSLPPLLLHAILTENAQYLTDWSINLPTPPEDCLYFNFTASHDGIGIRPIEGLVPDEEFEYLVESTQERGGFVSHKQNPNGTDSPYELNITYFDAFKERGKEDTERQYRRYMCSQIIMLSLRGLPGIYFQNIIASQNNIEGVAESGIKRDINRKKWDWKTLENHLADSETTAHRVLHHYKKLLQKRKLQPAFNPWGKQQTYDVNDDLFVFMRSSIDERQHILVVCNITRSKLEVDSTDLPHAEAMSRGYRNLLDDSYRFQNGKLVLDPYEVLWLEV